MKKTIIFLVFLCVFQKNYAQKMPLILSERQRAEVIDRNLLERFDSLLPQLMRREGIDMWILISREYNEDPVMRTMLPAEWLSARRRTVMVFFDNGKKGIEKLAIARYDVGLLKASWDLNVYPDQWEALVEVIKERNPKKIGLDISPNYAHADGLSHYEYTQFEKYLTEDYKKRIVSAEKLAVAWLETRTTNEMTLYEHIARISHQILREGLSNKVIQAGVTTTDDVVWWYRQRITELGLETWFHPTVSIQRAKEGKFDHLASFTKNDMIILPGDLLHVDFGISYLRLNTDMQEHAYVLRAGETQVPDFLQKAFKKANRVQDILTENFKTNLSGNEILANSLAQCQQEKINASIYTHPIGFHGHAAGPTIGMWDNQKGIKGAGDYPLFPNTAYSIELNAAVDVPEWDKTIRIMLEQDGFFDGKKFRYIDGRQNEIWVVQQ